jgi:integral membrane protein (TIGR00529 family)
MVEEVSKDLDVTQEWRVLVNYWFRHIWEFWWPMYPGVILAVSLSGIPLFSYVLLMFIFTPVVLIAGYFLLLKPLHTKTEQKNDSEFFYKLRMFLYHAMPILLILGVIVVFSAVSELLQNQILTRNSMSQYFPMFAGLLASGFWVYTKGKLKPIHIVHAIINRKTTMLLLLIVSVMAYKKVLSDCGAIVQMNAEMQTLGIPLMTVAVVLPFISGLVMGIAVGFVGASFPVLLGLISGSNDYLFYIVIAYMSGYTGMMISPIHMCLVLTKNHFTGAKMGAIYGKLIPLCAITFIFGLIYSLAIKILH